VFRLVGGTIIYCAVWIIPPMAGAAELLPLPCILRSFLSRYMAQKRLRRWFKSPDVEDRLRQIEERADPEEIPEAPVLAADQRQPFGLPLKRGSRLVCIPSSKSRLVEVALQTSQNLTDASTMRQNLFLATSSVIGTMAWGFGDWELMVASYIRSPY